MSETSESRVGERFEAVQERIAQACARSGRAVETVTLVAVSKTHPAESLLEALAAGARHFGENRVEESEGKIPAVMAVANPLPTWHMIGHIQSRKAKSIPPLFQVVHSVDRVKLAQKLSESAVETGQTLDILLECNVSGEVSKEGFEASAWETDLKLRESLWTAFAEIAALPNLRLRGLMTMAPIVEQMEAARPVFASLAGLRAAAADALKLALPDLSMGMTDDYPVAIEEGATIVRVGRAIFGERRARL